MASTRTTKSKAALQHDSSVKTTKRKLQDESSRTKSRKLNREEAININETEDTIKVPSKSQEVNTIENAKRRLREMDSEAKCLMEFIQSHNPDNKQTLNDQWNPPTRSLPTFVPATLSFAARAILKRKREEAYAQFLDIQEQLRVLEDDEPSPTAKIPKIERTSGFSFHKPPRFSGCEDYLLWWNEIVAYLAQFPEKDETEKIRLLNTCITGNARMIMNTTGTIYSIKQFDLQLRRVFVLDLSATEQIVQTIQRHDESVEQFAARLRVTVIKALSTDADIDTRKVDRECLTFFRTNTRKEIREKLNITFPATMEIAIQAAKHFKSEIVDHFNESSQKNSKRNNTEDALEKEMNNRFKQMNDKINAISKS